jgi:hypothetical protein
MQEMIVEVEELSSKIKESEKKEEEASAKEKETRKNALEIKLKFENGMTREEAEAFKAKLEQTAKELEVSKSEVFRYKELSQIASHQAQTIGCFRNSIWTS